MYDAAGNLQTVTDASNYQPTTNTYDVRNRLTKSCDALNGCATFTASGASGYDADDNLIQVASAAGEYKPIRVRLSEPPHAIDYDVGSGSDPSNVYN